MEVAMHGSAKMFQSAVAFLSMLGMFIVQAFAEDCFLLSTDQKRLELGDRQLYYQRPGGSGWVKMDVSGLDFSGQNIRFAYVILENFADARAGVLVIKSGRLRQMQETPAPRSVRRVQLVRLPDKLNNGTCGPIPDFGAKEVSAKSYDDYHDQGLNVPEIKTLRAFHFQYASRRAGCRRTNDDAVDSILPPDLRSNLSQFSFDRDVVARGTYSQVLAWFRINRAYASSENLANQRVEMKQYRTVAGQPVCVRFDLPVRGPASFLRLNDLESLSQSGLRYIRSDEQEWSLSP
jgi:hypothetical protein